MRGPLILSLKVALLGTLIVFFLGLFAARQVQKMKRGRGIADGLLTLPLVLPPTVLGFGLLVLFGRRGPLGTLLGSLGLEVIFTPAAAVIAGVVVAFPLMYRTTLGAFDLVDEDLLHAARTLGFSETKVFWRVLLPTAKRGVISGVILSFARILGEFGATMMIAGNIPGRTQTLSTAIYTAVQAGHRSEAGHMALLVAAMSFSGMMLLYLFGERRSL